MSTMSIQPNRPIIARLPNYAILDQPPVLGHQPDECHGVKPMLATKNLTARPEPWSEPTWDVALLFPDQGAWSEEEFLHLDTNRLVEFSHGRLEVLPMPTEIHQNIIFFLAALLKAFAKQAGGHAVLAPFRLRLWPGKIREPDIMFIAQADDPRRQQAFWSGADLVVEVLSDDDPQRDLSVKRFEYAQARIPEYWIVDPRAETLTVLALQGDAYREHGRFARGDTAGSATLAGLDVEVSALFDAE